MKPETLAEKTARLRRLRLEAEVRRPRPNPQYAPRHPVYGMGDELPFGRHRGEALEDVLATDPQWVRWALEAVEDFEVCEEALRELRYLEDPRRPVNRE